MKNLLKSTKILALVGGAILLSSCATISSKSVYDVNIDSNPSHLRFSVLDVNTNSLVTTGTTPQVVTLKASAGYFKKAEYKITITKRNGAKVDYMLTATIDSWYFGNVAFGGLTGFLAVDPNTGAMWKLPQSVVVDTNGSAQTTNKNINLAFVDVNSLTPAQKSQLIAIKPNHPNQPNL